MRNNHFIQCLTGITQLNTKVRVTKLSIQVITNIHSYNKLIKCRMPVKSFNNANKLNNQILYNANQGPKYHSILKRPL